MSLENKHCAEMSEPSDKIESQSVLWGEIQEQSKSHGAIDLWKPISDYQAFSKYKRDMDEMTLSSNCAPIASALEEESYDPVGSHLIELRNFYLQLYEYHRVLYDELENPDSKFKKMSKKLKFSIPKFPKKYPFHHSLPATSEDKRNTIIQWKNEPSTSHIEIERKYFIRKVLKQTGFFGTENDTVVVGYLSDLLHVFLQKISDELSTNISLLEDETLNILEKTLRDLGIGGISALHLFYYEKIAKKHDILFEKCLDLHERVKILRDKYPH